MEELLKKYRTFIKERSWEEFHNPKNLAAAISVEAAELLEIFTWLTPSQSAHPNPERLQQIKDEMGDVFLYLLSLADTLNLDLVETAKEKLVKVEQKYTLEKSLAFLQEQKVP